jgi:hypothetical protein
LLRAPVFVLLSPPLRSPWEVNAHVAHLGHVDICLLNKIRILHHRLTSLRVEEELSDIRRRMRVPVVREAPATMRKQPHQSPIARNTTSHPRDGPVVPVRVEPEGFGTIVHETHDAIEDLVDFVQAHLEHQACRRATAITASLVDDLTADYPRQRQFVRVRGIGWTGSRVTYA